MSGWLGSLLGKVSGRGGIKIIIVEDDTTTAKLLMAILEEKNHYEVHLAGNGLQALEMIPEVKPALIISDIMMPVMDGMKLLTELKSSKATASLPVIMLTSKSSDKDVMRGHSGGADYYIAKPFTKMQVLKGIKTVLGGAERTGQKKYKIK